MSTESQSANQHDKFRKTLSEHAARVQDVHTGFEVWSEYLTREERCRVGSFEEAYSRGTGGTIGMWARAKGISLELATLQLARLYGMPEGMYELLVKQLDGSETTSELLSNRNRPFWNHDLSELRLHGEVIKRIRNRDTGYELVLILDTFEKLGWPDRIDVQLPGGSNPSRLGDKIKSLNKNLRQIVFRAAGKGITWRRRA